MIFQTIKNLIIERLNLEEDIEITMDTSFSDDLEADSIGLVELIMSIEDEYDIEIDDQDGEKIKTVRDAVEYIEGIINKKS
ncbi:acyl carrier protein [Dethiosulfatibacter aminovorans DSM 17477]|uniref:Acyl carrier protein n=1 Tax=Dethiosulfatibacter aminovorans DSM 17477 TaxID=1121476 RepID=A0A1M6DGE4_9FIRM|nr:acyl carrier protein [Dethiosulfatibacter aminovorans]SHI72414.1 acyl carrier protein [Dethiosulfatibacter aminovorans DSM 17477]